MLTWYAMGEQGKATTALEYDLSLLSPRCEQMIEVASTGLCAVQKLSFWEVVRNM